MKKNVFPFTAIVGQEKIKKALILNAINPSIGGVLIKGDRGTAKTTAVRALTNLLGEIEVVGGDVFNSDLDSYYEFKLYEFYGKKGDDEVSLTKKPMRVVELPLGATEDRVVGSLDIEKALHEGIKALEPGLLAQANRNILYIDEINLLDDNLVDILLDAAAFGVNTIEREGISISHPSRFILVGTMNPEEGELRGQLSDRIGLKISVSGIKNIEDRIEIIKRLDDFEKDSETFIAQYSNKENELQKKIIDAQKFFPNVRITDDYIEIIARIVRNFGGEGHRSDIAILKTAKTVAAFNKHWNVELEDLEEAILLVLGEINQCDNEQIQNQIQQAQNEMNSNDSQENSQNQEDYNEDSNFSDEDQDHFNDTSEDFDDFDDNNYKDNIDDKNHSENENESNSDNNKNEGVDEDNESNENNQVNDNEIDDLNNENNDNDYSNDNQLQGEINDSEITDDEYQLDYNKNKAEKEIDEFDMESLEKDIRKMLVMEGREKEKYYGNRVNSKSEKGKYVKSKYSQKISYSDVAVDATLRAAAMRSGKKEKNLSLEINGKSKILDNGGLKINIKNHDIRQKVRKHKARASVAIVVDMSGSMLGEKKVNKIRGILDKIIKNINRNRDKVSVIGFKGQGSEIIIPNTKRPSSFLNKLDKMTVGGTTPMASGLEKALEILTAEKNKGEFIPMLILLSDGMPNVGLKDSSLKKATGSPVNDVLTIGEKLGEEGIYSIVIDFEKKHKHGRNINMELAFISNGRYYDLEDVYNPDIAIDKILTYERNIL